MACAADDRTAAGGKLIPLDLWPQNSADLNPVNYQILGVMQDRVYHTPVEDVTDV